MSVINCNKNINLELTDHTDIGNNLLLVTLTIDHQLGVLDGIILAILFPNSVPPQLIIHP